MRQRIESFLQTRLRRMLAPATIGLGLAMTACPSSGLDSTDDGGALVRKDAEPDQSAAMKYMAPLPPDAGRDGPTIEPVYMAPVPRDAGTEIPMAQPDYMAQMPDARMDSQPALRYMAQMPDASPDVERVQTLYMAQLPVSRS
jgi:hypothetical protein